MEQLRDLRIAQKPFEVGRTLLSRSDLHDMRAAVSRRQLYDAEPVAPWNEAERFRIDRDAVAKIDAFRQVAFMQADQRRAGHIGAASA